MRASVYLAHNLPKNDDEDDDEEVESAIIFTRPFLVAPARNNGKERDIIVVAVAFAILFLPSVVVRSVIAIIVVVVVAIPVFIAVPLYTFR